MHFNNLSNAEIDLKEIQYKIMMLDEQIHQSSELSEMFNLTISEVRKILKSDRIIIYQFLPDGDGLVKQESVSSEWKAIQGQLIYDPCFQAKWVEQYRTGRISAIEDIDNKLLDPCYRELLTKLQIRANLVVPILLNSNKNSSSLPQLWGLLIAHQCSSPRQWNPLEIKFLQLVAADLGIAIEQAHKYQQPTQKRSLQLHQNRKDLPFEFKQKFKFTKTSLRQNQQKILTTEAFPKKISVADLMTFDRLQTPIWIYDIQNLQMWWVNSAALHIWNVESREELLNRNFSSLSESTHLRLQSYLKQFEEGKIIAENWTFYPENQPVSVRCLCSGIQIEQGRLAMLVEGTTEIVNQIDQEILRAVETLRHTTLMISLYTIDGVPLMQNPAALRCYGDTLHPNSSIENTFVSHFVDKSVGKQAMEVIKLGEVFCIEAQVFTNEGIRWHEIDTRCTRDPVTGKSMILVNEKDITKQQAALQERRLAEKALRESEQRYRSVITAMAEGIVLQQADGRITTCNKSAERILGLTADQIIGQTSISSRSRAIHEDGSAFRSETHPAIVSLRTGQPQFNVVMGVHKPDGDLIWISINAQPLYQPDASTPYAVVTSFTDITSRKQAQLALKQQAQQERMIAAIAQHIRQSLNLDEILNTTVAEVRQFLQCDRVIIYRCNPDESCIVITESVAENWQPLLNMEITDSCFVQSQPQSHQQPTIKATSDIYTAGFAESHVQLLEQMQVRAKLVVSILQGDRLWGKLVVHHCSAPRAWQPWESELLEQLATQVAIAIQQSELYYQLQLANQQLQDMAMVDQLTQIANRRCFDHKLDSVWQYLLREQGFISILLCDIDYFKQYNDTYGHAAGDDCLHLIAQALQQTVKRSTDLVARYGGEEFVVILPNTDSDGAFQVAQEIHQAIQQLNIPHAASAVKPQVTLSLGIATLIPTSDMVPLDLIESADQALYQAKAQGRDRSVMAECS